MNKARREWIKVILNSQPELRDDRVPKQRDVDKMIDAYESGKERLIYMSNALSFTCAYKSREKMVPEIILN